MKRIFILLIPFLFTGCEGLNRLANHTEKEQGAPEFKVVACCQDNDGTGNMTWPSFVPQAHRNFCRQVEIATHNDQRINGDIYLATHVDCGKWGYKIGDEYYEGRNY